MIEAFASEAGYRSALAATITLARRELFCFDQDLLTMGLGDKDNVVLLTDFASGDRKRRIRFVVHDPGPMAARAPRLIDLLRHYGHIIEVRRTPEHLRHLAERWLLADEHSGVIRFHADHPRGKFLTDEAAEIQGWWLRAEDLWAEAEACSPASVTGL